MVGSSADLFGMMLLNAGSVLHQLAALSAENERLRRQGLEDGEGGRTEHKADEKGEGTRQTANTKTQLLKTARQELRDYEV